MTRFLALLAAALLMALPLRAQVSVEETTSPGGIDAWLVEESSIPFVALELRFEGGTSLDPPEAQGAVNLMTALLEEGAGELDAQAFAAAREGLAARFSFDASRDAVSVSARFLTENRDEAVALLRKALTTPRFDPAAIERVRAQILSGLRSDARDPNVLAARRFNELAFGDHPYGGPGSGTIESVTALTRDDLVAAHRAALTHGRVHVGAAGDIGPKALGALADDLLGGLPARGGDDPPRAEAALERGVTVVPFDGPQSVITFGHAGLPRDDPDFIPAYLLNEVLGGGRFGTRLMSELREERGLTYGVATYLQPLRKGHLMRGRLSVDNANAQQAIDIIRDQWAHVADEGITEEELAQVKKFLTGAYPLRFDGNAAIARILAGLQMQGLPASYVAERNAKVEAVTLEQVNEVAARLLDPASLRFVVAGRPEGLGEGS